MPGNKTVIITGAVTTITVAIPMIAEGGLDAITLSLANENAVVYLTEAGHVTGEVLHVDGRAHAGRW